MNEIIKVHNDTFAQKIYNEIEHKLFELEFDRRFEGKRKKYTFSLYEQLSLHHNKYDTDTVYAYWEFLAVTSVDFKNYLDVINPERTTDIEFVSEIIQIISDAEKQIHEHLKSINHNATMIYMTDFEAQNT